MAPRKKDEVFRSMLPATPCTPNMREQVEELAIEKKKSIAQVQRAAFALFLHQIVGDPNSLDKYLNDTYEAAGGAA